MADTQKEKEQKKMQQVTSNLWMQFSNLGALGPQYLAVSYFLFLWQWQSPSQWLPDRPSASDAEDQGNFKLEILGSQPVWVMLEKCCSGGYPARCLVFIGSVGPVSVDSTSMLWWDEIESVVKNCYLEGHVKLCMQISPGDPCVCVCWTWGNQKTTTAFWFLDRWLRKGPAD